MRKNLLASAAVLGGLLYSGLAMAQSVTSPALLPDARAMAGGVNPADNVLPAPGSVVVRFGGQMDWYAVTLSDSADRSVPASRNVTGPGATIGSGTPAKEAHYTFGDYIRLFPSVDGVAANGLRYGAFAELRVEQYFGTGGGSNGSVSGIDRSNTLYVRRAWGYLGLANLGTIRFGTGDGAGSLFDTGTFQNFDAGGWNGDIPNLLDSNVVPQFAFQGGVGAFYATDKLTYLSPQVYGLEFGLSFEPNTSNVTDYGSSGNASNTGSVTGNTSATGISTLLATSSSIAGDNKRRKNVINPELRYRNTFGPLGVALEAGYYKSAHVSYDAVATSAVQQYKGWDFSDAGAVLTFGGLSVGGHIMSGAFSGQGNLAPQGTRNAFAYIIGTSYTVGPIILGTSFFQNMYANHTGTTITNRVIGQERDRGWAAGATYTVTPGVSFFLSGVYGEKQENGYDIIDGAQNLAGSKFGNNTRAEAIGTGIQVKW